MKCGLISKVKKILRNFNFASEKTLYSKFFPNAYLIQSIRYTLYADQEYFMCNIDDHTLPVGT